jgi:Domain of unknown function (DUF4145)
MKCRHCGVSFHDSWTNLEPAILRDKDGVFMMEYTTCPACERLHVICKRQHRLQQFLYPAAVAREPLDAAVPADFASDYIEACNVIENSPKASAALSRRCLQHILRECAKVKRPNLDQEIQAVLDSKTLPSDIAESLDAVRNIGNFAAHPMKSTASGEIIDVEPGEAEWNLDTVERLFDFYFVGPAKTAAKKAALNKKLADAGKPPLK